MQIYEALKNDHDRLKPLLDELVNAGDAKRETRLELIGQIRDELVPHSRAEEAVFYNSLRTIDGTKALVFHGYAEHVEAESMLRALQVLEAGHVEWRPLAEKLREALNHHIQEEEQEIFSAARAVLTDEEATLMTDAFEKLKVEVKEGSMVQSTVDLIVNLMPVRFMPALRSFGLQPK